MGYDRTLKFEVQIRNNITGVIYSEGVNSYREAKENSKLTIKALGFYISDVSVFLWANGGNSFAEFFVKGADYMELIGNKWIKRNLKGNQAKPKGAVNLPK